MQKRLFDYSYSHFASQLSWANLPESTLARLVYSFVLIETSLGHDVRCLLSDSSLIDCTAPRRLHATPQVRCCLTKLPWQRPFPIILEPMCGLHDKFFASERGSCPSANARCRLNGPSDGGLVSTSAGVALAFDLDELIASRVHNRFDSFDTLPLSVALSTTCTSA